MALLRRLPAPWLVGLALAWIVAGEVATDFGVDVDNKVIRVGLNADLSGPFASLVAEIVAGQEVYWEVFNENGGYEGWTVEAIHPNRVVLRRGQEVSEIVLENKARTSTRRDKRSTRKRTKPMQPPENENDRKERKEEYYSSKSSRL